MYSRRVHFYETDKMGVVHHTNYLRYFEEARVDWHNQEHINVLPIWGQAVMAVLETKVEHKRPLRFNEEFEVQMQTKNEGTLFFYEYKIYNVKTKELVAQGSTKHVLLSPELKACKPPRDLLNVMEKESWTETWL
jgi:acyl-CoA thioester hydrolase